MTTKRFKYLKANPDAVLPKERLEFKAVQALLKIRPRTRVSTLLKKVSKLSKP